MEYEGRSDSRWQCSPGYRAASTRKSEHCSHKDTQIEKAWQVFSEKKVNTVNFKIGQTEISYETASSRKQA
jgi:hypothetical protein